jgi:molecular chaperone GrpE
MTLKVSFPSFNKKDEPTQKGQTIDIKEQVEQPAPDGVQDQPVNDGAPAEAGKAAESTIVLNAEEYNRLRLERDDFLNHLQRLQAEFDNYRKRVQKEKSDLRDYLIQDFIYRMLEVIDNIDRALHPSNAAADVNSYRQGVEMVFQQMVNILKDQGLVRMDTVGQAFDPRLHEAIGQQETGDCEAGVIVSEYMPGYTINDRVLRAPKVVVAVKPKDAAAGKTE